MKVKVIGRHLRVTKAIRDYIDKRLQRLERFDKIIMETVITLSKIKEDSIAEINIKLKNNNIHCKEVSEDMYSAIDLLIDISFRKLKKEISKVRSKRARKLKGVEPVVPIEEDGNTEKFKKPRLIKTDKYKLKPFFLEDAILELEDSGEQFIVFINAETEKMNVIYKRKDGNYGLIET